MLSRFSLPLGFGSKTIGELCAQSGINVQVFLLIVNFLLSGHIDTSRLSAVSAREVASFLHNSHDYYLQYKYPHIRANLLTALDPAHADINPIIVKYFDDYIHEVEAHFRYEEQRCFPTSSHSPMAITAGLTTSACSLAAMTMRWRENSPN